MRTRACLSVTLLVAATITGCSGADGEPADLTGTYVSECDPAATIEIEGEGSAVVNRNQCEGYAIEDWDYRVEGGELVMSIAGQLDDPQKVKERFEIGADELVLVSGTSFIACGNCGDGDVWVKQ